MKKLYLLLLFFTLVFPITGKAEFVEGLEDIPIPEGLEQIENGSLNFGNEEIRLIETYLSSKNLSFDKVVSFYVETLPQMGWTLKKQKNNKLLFEREGETLEISKEAPNPLMVRLTVKSKL